MQIGANKNVWMQVNTEQTKGGRNGNSKNQPLIH